VTETIEPDHRIFVSYIDKSREYYLAQGYGNPYRWAHNVDAPFARLNKPLAEARIGLVTTASLIDGDEAAQVPFSVPSVVYAAPVEPAPERLYTEHRFWDKGATHTNDLDSFAPIHRLQEAAATGRIGSLSPRFYGVPTEYSQRKTNETDAPELLRLCRDDGVDAAILVAL
jgi:Glycine/sarcosine/betaine reductase selenoprotein B (GRDB)